MVSAPAFGGSDGERFPDGASGSAGLLLAGSNRIRRRRSTGRKHSGGCRQDGSTYWILTALAKNALVPVPVVALIAEGKKVMDSSLMIRHAATIGLLNRSSSLGKQVTGQAKWERGLGADLQAHCPLRPTAPSRPQAVREPLTLARTLSPLPCRPSATIPSLRAKRCVFLGDLRVQNPGTSGLAPVVAQARPGLPSRGFQQGWAAWTRPRCAKPSGAVGGHSVGATCAGVAKAARGDYVAFVPREPRRAPPLTIPVQRNSPSAV